MRVLLCDDEASTLLFLEKNIHSHYGNRHTIVSFSDAASLHRYNGEADLLLMDIKLCEENGIEQAILFTKKHPKTKVIFISGYPAEYYEEIFNGIRPYAFLCKPIREERLFQHIDDIQKLLTEHEPFRFLYKGAQVSIPMVSIKHIESHGRQKFLFSDNKTYIINQSFEQLQAVLSSDFVRCHSAFLVNMNFISDFTPTHLVMCNGALIPIGRKYKAAFKEHFFNFKESRL